MDFNSGGKKVIERLVEAYGVTTRQALCDHLGVSKSTMATRYMRDIFPADWVIQCALETGMSLNWIVTGNGPNFEPTKKEIIYIPSKNVTDGHLHDESNIIFDKSFLPDNITKPLIANDGNISHLVEEHFEELNDGKWLINIEGKISIREIARIPIKKVRVSNDSLVFECDISDIPPLAYVKRIFS